MSRTWLSPCRFCKHFDVEAFDGDRKARKIFQRSRCKAFPERIPITVGIGDFDHRQPHPDDRGYQFEKQTDISKLPEGLNTLTQEHIDKILNRAFESIENRTEKWHTDSDF